MDASTEETIYCTSCGQTAESDWKFCRECGSSLANERHSVSQGTRSTPPPLAYQLTATQQQMAAIKQQKPDRRVAFQCAKRWAMTIGCALGLIFGLFMPVTAQRSPSSKTASSAMTTIDCSNVFGMLTKSETWQAVSVADSQKCATQAQILFFVDAALVGLLWALVMLGVAYLINRNRIVRDPSLWFPYRLS